MQVLYAKRLRELLDIWQPPTPKANEKAITKKEYLQAAMMSMVINRKRRFDTDFVVSHGCALCLYFAFTYDLGRSISMV